MDTILKKLTIFSILFIALLSSCGKKEIPKPHKVYTFDDVVDSVSTPNGEVIVNIDLGEFSDIQGFNQGAHVFYDNIYDGNINYCIYSVTPDYKQVLSILTHEIPAFDINDGRVSGQHWWVPDREVRKESFLSSHRGMKINDEPTPKKGWIYLYNIKGFHDKEWEKGKVPVFFKACKVTVTPCALEAMAVVMKMLRKEKLDTYEKEIAKKYQAQVNAVLKKHKRLSV